MLDLLALPIKIIALKNSGYAGHCGVVAHEPVAGEFQFHQKIRGFG
jgi:hypothetical protein